MKWISDIHPSVAIGITLLVAMYLGAAILGKHRVTPSHWLWFVVTVAVTGFTLGPVDEWAEQRCFTMHMLQHFNQSFVIPPLMLLAVPASMLRPWVLSKWVRPFAEFFTRPVIAFLTFTAVFVVAHNPPIFNLMCRDENVHIAIHLAFMVSGVIMWWPILSPLPELPRLSYPLQIFYVFLLMIPMTAVAAPITLAYSVVYPWYLEGPHPFGLRAMEDQILGGLLMWIGQGTYLMCVFTVIFYQWSRREDDSDTPYVEEPSRPRLRAISGRLPGRLRA
jgi:putative membrane protein